MSTQPTDPQDSTPDLRQNSEYRLTLLAAQKQLYTEAKQIRGGLAIAVTLLAIVGSGAIRMSDVAMGWIVAVTVVAFVAEPIVAWFSDRKQEQAASIQEQFDHEVLEIPWNETLCVHPSKELIKSAACRHFRNPKRKERLKDWYKNKDLRDKEVWRQQMGGQLENWRWEMGERTHWRCFVCMCMLLTFFIPIAIGLGAKMHFDELTLGPLLLVLPLFSLLLDIFVEQTKLIGALQAYYRTWGAIKDQAEDDETHDPQDIERKIRQLQDRNLMHRMTNRQVPDWFYYLYSWLQDHGLA